ncbi:conjugative transposon protein TraK [Chondrinema litorale]|uniref:conjugative transposon protein TraK n=1 Tax=Chondrinema litorale TaxID=2994555 RepID=UPI000C472F59|nr:conjugative transposon protein TraK [Chondrinema litorale]MBT28360.1 conjugative transposon protein TraK [Thalassovita sp.]UZS00018.1 conjugative transposon protein TraK [Chondrinema litorale]
MLLKNIETKIKVSLITSLTSIAASVVIVGFVMSFAYSMVSDSRKNIYILDNGIPVLVQQTGQDVNRMVEYKSHINLYHMLFFTLPPDDEFMKNNINKSMYLIDKSGLTEYNNLKEKGYYNAILSSSASLSIKTDSIEIDMDKHTFRYYGVQRIERDTRILTRELVTTGGFKDVMRSENNPHGVLITNWKTVLNKDISDVKKKSF